MLLYDEVAAVIMVLVLNTRSNSNARNKDSIPIIAFKFCGSIYLTTQSFVDKTSDVLRHLRAEGGVLTN